MAAVSWLPSSSNSADWAQNWAMVGSSLAAELLVAPVDDAALELVSALVTSADSSALSDPSPPPPQAVSRTAAAAFDSVQPPAEIASSWQVVGDAVQAFSDTANSVDATTPEGQQQLQTAAQDFVTVAGGPDGTAVQQFGQANCGTAAPTT